MPRGVYDRSKAKMKRQQQLAGTPTVLPVKQGTTQPSSSGVMDIHALNTHLNLLVATRAGIVSIQHDHNPQLISAVDQEIMATVNTLRTWRESTFPVAIVVPAKTSQPVVTTAPSYVPPPPAPLPFTPAQVQDTLKSQGNAAAAPQG